MNGPTARVEAEVSKSVNKVTLIGNLGADPEVRSTTNGGRVATLSLATSKVWKDAKGAKQEKTSWHRIVCWNNPKGAQLADLMESYARKGSKLYIEGEIEYRSWDNKDGVKQYTTEIVAREVVLLGDEKGEAKPRKADTSFDDVPEEIEDDGDDSLPF